jgi:hypothetical protein
MTRYWNNLHQVRSKQKYLKAKTILKSLEVRKPKALDRIAKIFYGHVCPREK